MEINDFETIEVGPCIMVNLKTFEFNPSHILPICDHVVSTHKDGFYVKNENGYFIPVLSAKKLAKVWIEKNIGNIKKIEAFIISKDKKKISLKKEDIETYNFLKQLYELYPSGFYSSTLSVDKRFNMFDNFNTRSIGCFLDTLKNKIFNDLMLTNNKNPLSKTHVSKKWKVKKVE